MAPVSKQSDANDGSCTPACIATGESSIEALLRVEAECGWSDAPWLMSQAGEPADDEGWAGGGVGQQP